jgi:glutaminase
VAVLNVEGTRGTTIVREPVPPYVSTGTLPRLAEVAELVEATHREHRHVRDGEVSTIYPALAVVDPDLFGICVASVDGSLVAAGDAETPFAVMSAVKPFTFALVCDAVGPDEARRRLGVNATGRSFNALEAIDDERGGRTNPMVNPGAIAALGLLAATSPDAPWESLQASLSAFAGRPLELDASTYRSSSATNHQNHAIARRLVETGALIADPDHTLDLYTRQCALSVTATDLAVMAATLADGGVNPLTGARVVSEVASRCTLAVMATAGLYENSGDWLYEIGLPGKSGIGGGIVAVSPGKGGLGTFSPRLDEAGNSVRGQLVARQLSHGLGLDLFASQPVAAPPGTLDRR